MGEKYCENEIIQYLSKSCTYVFINCKLKGSSEKGNKDIPQKNTINGGKIILKLWLKIAITISKTD